MSRRHGGLFFIIGSLSFVLLGYQISLMRILSYVQWYHFAAMIISVALLGFGGAGTVLSLFRKRAMVRAEAIMYGGSIICLVLTALTPLSLSWISIDPFLILSDIRSSLGLVLFIGLLIVPFFSGAFVIGLSFVLHPGVISRSYFANLMGSALGIVGAVALLEFVPPERLPPLLALIALPGVWILVAGRKSRIVTAAIATAAVFLLFLHPGPGMSMSQFKPLARARLLPETRVTERTTNPLGVIEIVEGPSLRYAPGLSLTFQGKIPSHKAVFHDGEWTGPLIPQEDSLIWPVYDHSASGLPYCLVRLERVLVIGAGTGSELLFAHRNGSARVTGIEMNPELVRIFDEEYKELLGRRRKAQVIEMICDEARSFLQRDTSRYSLIVLPILEGQTASAAGTQAQFENYLFTVESFVQVLRRLESGGIFFVQTWMNTPPRASAKVLGTVIEALRSVGIGHPERHLAGIRSWNTVGVAVSRKPFTEEQVQNVRRFSGMMGFDLFWLPGLTKEETNQFHKLERPYLFECAQSILGGKSDEYTQRYFFRIEPATDNRPYFSNFISWRNILPLFDAYRSGEIPYLELGTFFLALTVLQVGILSLVLIGLPLVSLVRSGASIRSLGTTLVYFGGLGLGYMSVEMVLIQKTVLFLGDPIYSVAVVVGSLLCFSSLGSAVSPSVTAIMRRRAWVLPATVIVLLVLYLLALSPLLSALLSLPAWARLLVLPVVVSPLGVVLGVPFPIGLTRLAEKAPLNVPLAWGVNGYCSVLAASTAVLVSMELGFRALQLFAVIAYATAFTVFVVVEKVQKDRPA